MFGKLKSMLNGNQLKVDFGKYKVLVVEDGEVDQRLIVDILTKQGYQTVLAKNGMEGLEAARAHQPDLIVLDCEMPVMGGIEMCKTLKSSSDISGIPVVFLTSLDTPKNIIDCFELDAENYISKPISPKILLSEVASVLNISSN